MLKKTNGTSSDLTRKWIKITHSHLKPDLKKKYEEKIHFSYKNVTLPIQVAICKYQFILACKVTSDSIVLHI